MQYNTDILPSAHHICSTVNIFEFEYAQKAELNGFLCEWYYVAQVLSITGRIDGFTNVQIRKMQSYRKTGHDTSGIYSYFNHSFSVPFSIYEPTSHLPQRLNYGSTPMNIWKSYPWDGFLLFNRGQLANADMVDINIAAVQKCSYLMLNWTNYYLILGINLKWYKLHSTH